VRKLDIHLVLTMLCLRVCNGLLEDYCSNRGFCIPKEAIEIFSTVEVKELEFERRNSYFRSCAVDLPFFKS
jgi:hypothetical protein